MAEVFRSKIVLSHGFVKPLVIKRILPHLAEDTKFVSMFIDEAKLTAQLTHPKIVQILDFGDVTGQYFIALELVDGFDALVLLRTCAQRRVRMPLPLALFVTMDVLEALDYAHNAKDMDERPMHIVHRDISPSNIFISKRGDVKLGDFGIAHTPKHEGKTQSGALKGKHGYMSPEQVNGGALDGRSDLYSIGVVLAEMLMGRRLFVAPSDLDVLLMVREGRLDRLDQYGADLPPALDAIVRRALETDPAERYQTATAFRDALSDYLLESGQRVGASDLRAFGADLFDGGAEASARLEREPKAPDFSTARGTIWAPPPATKLAATRRPDADQEATVTRAGTSGSRSGEVVGHFVSNAPQRLPDSAGDVGVISPMRVFSELAVARETGLLRFEFPGQTKEIYFVGGAPDAVTSSLPNERFGEYLVAKGALRFADLERALATLHRYAGRLGDTVVGLGFMKPLDVFRMLSQQVRDRVIDVFTWTEGTFAFFRGVTSEQRGFPLGLDAFELMGLGVLGLPGMLLERSFERQIEHRPSASGRTHIDPERFRLGPTPGEVLEMLDRKRTLRSWMSRFTVSTELLTFLRSLYLLVESDLVRFD